MSCKCGHRCGCESKYKYKYKYKCACSACTKEYCGHSTEVADPPPFRRGGFRRFPEFRESPRFRELEVPFFEESPFFGRRFR